VVPLWEEARGCREGGNFEGVLAALDPLERLIATAPESDLPADAPAPGAIRALRDAAERLLLADSASTDCDEAPTVFDSSTGFEPVGGRTIGRYTAIQVIGVRSTGTVYLAEQDGPEGFRRPVALKVLHRQLAQHPGFLRAFQREARIAARLSHPNILAVTDLGQVGDEWFLAMDYVSGCSVRRLIDACPNGMPADIALLIASGVAAGLAHAHTSLASPVVHRDVCPENVIVDREGIPRVFDFGLARAADTIGPPTETGALRGRASYVPPERLEEGTIGPPADLWSLAVVLYELLTGQKLFDGRTVLDVLDAICLGDLTEPLERIDRLDAELGGWVRQMLVRDPAHRTGDATALAEALERMAMRLRPFDETPRRRLAALVADVAGPPPIDL
jgi:serine/threonine-protein kinase